MKSGKWLLFKENLKKSLVCIKDCKSTEVKMKMKSVYTFTISNITGTWRHPMKIIATYET